MKKLFKYMSCILLSVVALCSMGCAKPGERAAEEFAKKDLAGDPSYTKVRYEVLERPKIGKLTCKTINADNREVLYFYYFDLLDDGGVAFIPVPNISARVLAMMEKLDNAGFKKDTWYYDKVSKLHRSIEDDSRALIRDCIAFDEQEEQDADQLQDFRARAQEINERVDVYKELLKQAPKYLLFEYEFREMPGHAVVEAKETQVRGKQRLRVSAYVEDEKP